MIEYCTLLVCGRGWQSCRVMVRLSDAVVLKLQRACGAEDVPRPNSFSHDVAYLSLSLSLSLTTHTTHHARFCLLRSVRTYHAKAKLGHASSHLLAQHLALSLGTF
jgi:hypothetical protein